MRSKEKAKPGKIAGIDKLIMFWEEKLSLAELNKNKQEAMSIKRVLEFYKKRRESGVPLH